MALQLVDRIGELWEGMTVDERAAFVAEWFAEARIAADGGVEWVAREPYFAIVAASSAREVRTVGSTGLEAVQRHFSRYGLFSQNSSRRQPPNRVTQLPSDSKFAPAQ